MSSFYELLVDPDRRSMAGSEVVRDLVRHEPSRVRELVAVLEGDDAFAQMRALDLLEKLARENREWVEPCKGEFLRGWDRSDIWENRLATVRALGLFEWSGADLESALSILRRLIDDEQKFVKAWALDSFALISLGHPELKEEAVGYVMEALGSGAKSVQARARSTAKRLGLKLGD